MKIKKSQIVPLLKTLVLFDEDTKQEKSGLLTEKIPMSLRRRLQRIRADILVEYHKLVKEENDLKERASKEEFEKELDILVNEEVDIKQDFVSLDMIEAIETSVNYDFELIELIAK